MSGPSQRRIAFGEHFRFGAPEIDREHAQLVNILNATLAPGLDADRVRELLHHFALVYSAHCRTEELYLQSTGYTGLDEHSREHSALSQRINECYRAFGADPTAARGHLASLCVAFADHLLRDLQYKSHIDQSRGR